jgi:hypothetical protein
MFRDPFQQVISSYNYHMQVPGPERWVHSYTRPSMPSEQPARYVPPHSLPHTNLVCFMTRGGFDPVHGNSPERRRHGPQNTFRTAHSRSFWGWCSQAAQESIANRLRIPSINLTSVAQLHVDLFTSAHAADYEKALHTLSAEDGVRPPVAQRLRRKPTSHLYRLQA